MKFDVSKRSEMRRAVVISCIRAACLTLVLWLWALQAEAADTADGIIRFDFGPVPTANCIGPLDATHLSAQGHGFELTVVGSGTEKLQSYNLARYIPSDNLAPLWAWRRNPQWHNGVYTDAEHFTLCLAGPKGKYLISIYVGMFSEQESKFELTIGKERPADVLHAPMPADDRRGVPFGIHRVIGGRRWGFGIEEGRVGTANFAIGRHITQCGRDLPVAEVEQVIFVEAEVVAYFVEDGLLDLADELFAGAADTLDVVFEEDDALRPAEGLADAAIGQRRASVYAQQGAGVPYAKLPAGLAVGDGFDVDDDIPQILLKELGDLLDGFCDGGFELGG